MTDRLCFDSRRETLANAPLEVGIAPINLVDIGAPASPLETAMAGSIDTDGDLVAARRHQNRQVTLRLDIIEPPSEPAATNLCTNPSFEIDASGWVTTGPAWFLNSGATLTQATVTDADSGEAVGHVLTPGSNAAEGATHAMSPAGGFLAGTAYTAVVRARVVSTGSRNMDLAFGDASADSVTVSANPVAGAFQTIVATWTPASTRATGYVCVRTDLAGAAVAIQFEIDSAIVVTGAAAPAYFDGDTPGCAWAGTPGLSASTRPAPGGARFKAILADLQAKVAKVAREGGTLTRVDELGTIRTLDLLAADRYEPTFDLKYFNSGAATVDISLVAQPYLRGPEQQIPLSYLNTLPLKVGPTTTAIPGDVEALGRLTILEQSGQDRGAVWWGVESLHYDPAVPLIYQAESLGGTIVSRTGASGGATNNAKQLTLPGTGSAFFTLTDAFVGTFRVLARVQANVANTGITTLLLRWAVRGGPATSNAFVPIPTTNAWWLLDLGLFTADPAPWGGTQQVSLTIFAQGGTGSNLVYADTIEVIPCAEGAGYMAAETAPFGTATSGDPVLPASGVDQVSWRDVLQQDTASTLWAPPTVYTGDYLRLRPGAPARIAVRAVRAGLLQGLDPGADTDQLAISLYVTPRYLSLT